MTLANENCPSSPEAASRLADCAPADAGSLRLAPATTAPLWSTTVPLTFPPSDCAVKVSSAALVPSFVDSWRRAGAGVGAEVCPQPDEAHPKRTIAKTINPDLGR